MAKKLLLAVLLLCSCLIYAQPGLQVGDKCPDVELSRYVNGEILSQRLSSFAGRYIILDFWKTYCGACVSSLSGMEKLKAMWPDGLEVLAVNDQPIDLVRSFWGSNVVTSQLSIGTVVGENDLSLLFPYLSMPHLVILDPDRVVVAITYKEYVNADNISSLLNGGTPYFEPKFENGSDGQKKINKSVENKEERSALGKVSVSGYAAGERRTLDRPSVDTLGGLVSLKFVNRSLPDLIAYTIEDPELVKFRKRWFYLSKDPSELFVTARKEKYKKEWEKKYLYGYRITFAEGKPLAQLKPKIRSDLSFFFNLDIVERDSLMPVWVLRRLHENDKVSSVKKQGNFNLSTLYNIMNAAPGLPNVLNETALPDDFEWSTAQLPLIDAGLQKMNEQLLRLNLYLREEKRLVKLLFVE
ncbi:peroxiredoxin family protein [Sphingobacterium sp. LRF_L2]|uniref:peroxiredoxin family protein n=1 Tax=Sphingobacterium sp. LRF_L2 TaxID=3369421 RepID=UPI003F5FAE92